MREIKNRFTNEVIYTSNKETIREAVKEAISKNINLNGANLTYANLTNANLTRADLYKVQLDENVDIRKLLNIK